MDYGTTDDEALIRLVAEKNKEALSELYDRYSRLIYAIAYHFVGNPATAEEITLDVFMRLWNKAELYDPHRASVKTWLTRVARNRAIDEVRRRNVRLDHDSLSLENMLPPARPASSGRSSNPEDVTELALMRRRVREAVDTLPDEQKQALFLAYFRGLTHRGIAEMTGLPLGTVKTRIRLAMNKLRKLLADEQ